jgi:putative toxin-antitoxin system antitoxin component (TIGR02293 family)
MTMLKSYSEASRTARFLGLKGWRSFSDIDLAVEVKKGLPASAIAEVFGRLDLHEPKYIHRVVPKATLARKKEPESRLSQAQSERLLALSKVFSAVLRLYGDDTDSAALFLLREHPLLGGRAPFELAAESVAGAEAVFKLVARAEAGVAV